MGIIGCGYAAEHLHLPVLRSLDSLRVVAIADTDTERLQLVGQRFAIQRRYDRAETLLRDDEVDAVAVCVPPSVHAEVILAALAAQKHVLVEKPLCLELGEADRLVERARHTPLVAMVGFNLRYHRHVGRARELIANGEIGTVELLRTVWSSQTSRHSGVSEWRRHCELGGGVLNDLGVHHLDLWRFLLGTEVEDIFASSRAEGGVDQTATLTARLQNGVLALSGFAHGAAEAHEIEVYGRRARLLISPYRFDGFEVVPAASFSGDLQSRMRRSLRTVQALPGAIAHAGRGGSLLESYRGEWQRFVGAVVGEIPPGSTFADGRCALELVRAAVESSRTGRRVRVGRPHQANEGSAGPGG